MDDADDFNAKLAGLGEFWERITFPNGVTVGPGRNKALLWERYLSHHIRPESLAGKSVLDIGCNAGGNLVELAKAGPARLVGIEGNETFYRQAVFVMEAFGIDAEIRQYKMTPDKTPEQYAEDIGRFDVIFLLGVIYHLNRKTNLGVLRYIRDNCTTCYCSSQLFTPASRPHVDWELTKQGHEDLFREAGFQEIVTIHEKSEDENWSALTNQWYFEVR